MVKNKKQQQSSKTLKPAGTRMGTAEDWRVGGGKGRENGDHGKTVRDGR